MKAITIGRYGGPDVLETTELPEPKVGPDVVLVRTRAVGVNPVDWLVREGYLDSAYPSAFPLIPGWDVAGVVERPGPAVPEFSAGDEVVGYCRKDWIQEGTYAELVAAPVRALARKPQRGSWTQAGGLPLAGLTAWQALRIVGVGPGDTVLVHAAAGGVGHLAVQIARHLGARVIGTASRRNADFIRQLGGEPVEYGPGLEERVRAIAPDGVTAALDLVGPEAVAQSFALVAAPARVVSVADPESVLGGGGRYHFVRPNPDDLAQLSRLIDEDALTVHVDRTFPLDQAADAQRTSQEGHVRGKLVLEVM
jgi:NADPH:quinone reductase-like Zn-dependent oxidoreductase